MEESNASFSGTRFVENAAKFGACVETFISEFHVREWVGVVENAGIGFHVYIYVSQYVYHHHHVYIPDPTHSLHH